MVATIIIALVLAAALQAIVWGDFFNHTRHTR